MYQNEHTHPWIECSYSWAYMSVLCASFTGCMSFVLKSTNFLLVNLASTYCSYWRLVYTLRVGGNGKHMGSISTPLNGYVRRVCSFVKSCGWTRLADKSKTCCSWCSYLHCLTWNYKWHTCFPPTSFHSFLIHLDLDSRRYASIVAAASSSISATVQVWNNECSVRLVISFRK